MSLLGSKEWEGKIFIDGWVSGSGGEYAVTEPATGDELGKMGSATPGDVERAAELAVEAQKEWAGTSVEERAGVMRRAGDLFSEHAGEIIDWIVRESGSIQPKGGFEIHLSTTDCYEAASLPTHPYGELIPSPQPRLSMSRRRPVGVVGVISPFNAPLFLALRAVAPALALGNAVLLKPDLRTAVCGGVTISRIFEEAGLPSGLLSVLPGGVNVGEAVVANPHVGVVAFTGSIRGGRAVAKLAAEHLKRAHLELGSNSAVIVLDDADVEKAVDAAAFGAFFHQGQICMASSRHLVHSKVVGDYTEAMVARAKGMAVGNPATEQVAIGPIIDERQRDNVHALVTASVSGGAALATGGEYEGLYYEPTVLTDVSTSAPVYLEEIFGPVAPITTFNTEEEAVAMATSPPCGLSLGVFTRDVMKGLRLADTIPTGAVHINDQTINDESPVPFGGMGQSGSGSRIGGIRTNIEAFTEAQWVTIRGDVGPYSL